MRRVSSMSQQETPFDELNFEYLGRHAAHAEDVTGIAMHFDGGGASVLSVSHDAVMCVHRVNSADVGRIHYIDMAIDGGMASASAICVAVPPDACRLSTSEIPSRAFVAGEIASDYVVQVWNVEQRAALQTLRGHTSPITDVKFGPLNNGPLASASLDGHVILWEWEEKGKVLVKVPVDAPVLDLEIEPHVHLWYGTEDGHLCAYRV